jgi:hypothetical protein
MNMKNIKYTLGLILTATVLLSCSEKKQTKSTKYYKPQTEAKTCRVCYKTYTGSGHTEFGIEYCSMECYVFK